MHSDEFIDFARRIREVREELYGPEGGPHLAKLLGISARTWSGYEGGAATIPDDVTLRFVSLTRARLGWLLTGKGPRYGPRQLSG